MDGNHSASKENEAGLAAWPPGQSWMKVLTSTTPEKFAAAFAPGAELDGSVFPAPVIGAEGIRKVFYTTRRMYDVIAFRSEVRTQTRTYLEWEGLFLGEQVSGLTVLSRNEAGLIESVRLYHRPKAQLEAFSNVLFQLLNGG